MYRTNFDTRRQPSPPVGLAKDFLNQNIVDWHYGNAARQPDVRKLIEADDMLIPATIDREGYHGDRHLEYWLSGYISTLGMSEAFPALLNKPVRVLDFGGATGRVSRHVTQQNPQAEMWLADIKAAWITWIDTYFNRPIRAFQARVNPALPIEDNHFDFIFAFSVFTHLDTDEIPWLLELRRILKPGGMLYLTVLDDAVWNSLRTPRLKWLADGLQRGIPNPEYLSAIAEGRGIPNDRFVLTYSDDDTYNVNIFLGRRWISRKWGPFFTDVTVHDAGVGEVQSRVFLTK